MPKNTRNGTYECTILHNLDIDFFGANIVIGDQSVPELYYWN
jgi:hypothetical protein